jgi:L-fuconolactonase
VRSVHEQKAWLEQVQEPVVEPERPIVDAHHHLWRNSWLPRYLLDDLWADTESGHRIVMTVFVECDAEYRSSGPPHLRSVGETAFVTELAKRSRSSGKAEIAGIVAHADLTQSEAVIRETCDHHSEVSDGLFRGIRQGGAHAAGHALDWNDATALPDLYERDEFRRGVALLGRLGLTYDTWHYHFQSNDFLALARAVPDTVMVLDHLGVPVGVQPFNADEVFQVWRKSIAELASCENVVLKLGGVGMPPNGFGWHLRNRPPTSEEVVAKYRNYYLHAIECFGPDRCMFESNFPVDKLSMSYVVYWNAMKKLTLQFSETERQDLFFQTACRVYRLGLNRIASPTMNASRPE